MEQIILYIKKFFYYFFTIVFLPFYLLLYRTNHTVRVKKYFVNDKKIPREFNGFSILHLSDLHGEKFGKNNDKLVDLVKEQNADVIVITGDIVDSARNNGDFSAEFDLIKRFSRMCPVYFVAGNHEARLNEKAYGELKTGIIENGAIVLSDEKVEVKRGNSVIYFKGIEDYKFKQRYDNKKKVDERLKDRLDNISCSGYSILLAHRPEKLYIYDKTKEELVLCGHAHGGQFRIPFGLYSPGQGLFPKYTKGEYNLNNTRMIVSAGLGNSTFPFRLNDPPEISLISLKNDE